MYLFCADYGVLDKTDVPHRWFPLSFALLSWKGQPIRLQAAFLFWRAGAGVGVVWADAVNVSHISYIYIQYTRYMFFLTLVFLSSSTTTSYTYFLFLGRPDSADSRRRTVGYGKCPLSSHRSFNPSVSINTTVVFPSAPLTRQPLFQYYYTKH